MAESFPDTGETLPTLGMARMMSLDREEALWSDTDKADILQHQLSAPILPDVRRSGAIDEATLSEIQSAASGSTPATFGQVLLEPAGPLQLLRAIKDFGKFATQENGPLPSEVAFVLYYGAIIAALLRYGQRITGMEDASLRKGAEWVSQQTWVDETTRSLFREGLARLSHRA